MSIRGVSATKNATNPYKKKHKFIRDKRISLFLRLGGKEDKAAELWEKKNKKDKRKEREKENDLLVYPRQESYIWKSEKRPDTWKIPRIQEGYLVSEIGGWEAQRDEKSLNLYSRLLETLDIKSNENRNSQKLFVTCVYIISICKKIRDRRIQLNKHYYKKLINIFNEILLSLNNSS